MNEQRSPHPDHVAYQRRLDEIDEATFAWFGGWLSADGSILEPHPLRPRIRFVLTDRDPLDRFAELFGNTVGGPYPPSGLGVKDRYEWAVGGWQAVMILRRVRPWLSVRYTERAAKFERWVPKKIGRQVLTPSAVAEIRSTTGYGTGRRLARKFGVSEGLVSAVRLGRCWKNEPLSTASSHAIGGHS